MIKKYDKLVIDLVALDKLQKKLHFELGCPLSHFTEMGQFTEIIQFTEISQFTKISQYIEKLNKKFHPI